MRNDLKAVQGIVDVETDVDAQKVIVRAYNDEDIKAILNKVAESNNKLKDWEFVEN